MDPVEANQKDSSESNSELRADQPISSASDDLLGRSPFAKRLASAIVNWKEDESLVIALYGQWGIGKTSVKNLVLEQLRGTDTEEPDVVEFNPWHWTGHDGLAAAFFKDVLAVLTRNKNRRGNDEVARSLRRYASYLGVLHGILSPPKELLTAALLILGGLSLSLPSFLSDESAVRLGRTIGLAILGIALALQWGKGLLENLATWRERMGVDSEPLEERKSAVVRALKRVRRTVVVVIDDVDRLSATEIQSVFQLVKANADFPRFVYLLIFQRNVVEAALEKAMKQNGTEYLEKIIQIGFDVPPPRQDQIDTLLFEGVGRVLAPADSASVSQTYWGNVYFGCLQKYFRDLRDVKRFLASWEFHLGLLRTNGTLEVNPVDLISIEAVRLFDPELHRRIRDARPLLTAWRSGRREDRKEDIEEIKALVNEVATEKEAAQELIKTLFPNVEFAFGGTFYSPESKESWVRELRVCTPEFFDRYFLLGLGRQEVSQHEVERLVLATSDTKAMYAHLERLAKDGLLEAALESLFAHREKIAPENAVPTLTALFDIGELLPPRNPGSFGDGPDWTITRLAYQLLRKSPEPDRVEKLEEALKASIGLRLPIMFISVSAPTDREHSSDSKLLSEADLSRVQGIGLDKIRGAAQEGKLIHQIDLIYILFRWLNWARDADEVRKWAEGITASPQGALAFLRSFLHKGTSSTIGDRVAKINFFMKYSEVDQFVDVYVVETQINKLTETRLPEEDHLVLQEFRKAITRKRKGKKEGDWGFDED